VKKLVTELQKQHFRTLSAAERRATIEDCYNQIKYIAGTKTRAGLVKRAELQARIEFLHSLNGPRQEAADAARMIERGADDDE
jgi:hypothetical protein